jgi:recombination protein RecA
MAAELSEDRKKALNVAISLVERQHGKGAIMRMGAEGARVKVEAISTGSIALDAATGIGGIPRGRVAEVYGPESSGKTTLTLHMIANAHKGGGVAAFIDAEHALDINYAEKLGVDVENLLVSQPDTGEQALEIAEVLVRSSAVDIVVIDSVAALVPRAEIEGEMGASHVGLQARLMSQALRNRTRPSYSPIRSARRSASCSGIRRPSRAAGPSSSTPRCVSTSGASHLSRTATTRSATGPGSRS